MFENGREAERNALTQSARMLCVAARTAPKGRGKDLLETAILSGEDKNRLAAKMREIGQREQLPFYERDAKSLDQVDVALLIGTRKEPLGLPACGFCGFTDCKSMLQAGGTCSFNAGDLGIAMGSLVSRAADLRIDNRIMFSMGKAAVEMSLLGDDVAIAYGVPLSVSSKSPFFDR